MNWEIPKYMKGKKSFPCCVDHCRDWRETKNGKIPASNHSPSCENYKPIKFLNLFFKNLEDGYTIPPDQLYISTEEMLPEDTASLRVTEVFMTQDQYDRLDEFQGF